MHDMVNLLTIMSIYLSFIHMYMQKSMEVNIKETFSAFNITYLRRLLKVDRAPFAGSVTNAQNPKCVNYISFALIKALI